MKTRRWDEAAAVEGLHEHTVSLMSKRILIVEDNDINMKLFPDLLEAHGYATLQSKDGMEEQATRTSHSNFSPARAPGQTPARSLHCSSIDVRFEIAGEVGALSWIGRKTGRSAVSDLFRHTRRLIEHVCFDSPDDLGGRRPGSHSR